MLSAILFTCASIAIGQEIMPTLLILNSTQQAQCQSGPGLIQHEEDCCHFVLCEEPRGMSDRGWVFECAYGTVWNPTACACVLPEQNPYCDITACPTSIKRTTKPCPPVDTINATEQCCLESNGIVFTSVNATSYYKDNETEIQSCPIGQVFLVDDCCCEGDTFTAPNFCMQFNFDGDPPSLPDEIDQSNKSITNLLNFISVTDTVLETVPLSNRYGVQFKQGARLAIPHYNGAWFGHKFTISFDFRLEDITRDTLILHNGDEDGVGASIKIEFISCPEGLFIAAGVCGCDRVEDIVEEIDSRYMNGDWGNIVFRYDDGTLNLNVVKYDGTPGSVSTINLLSKEVDEPDPLKLGQLQKLVKQYNARVQDEIVSIKSDIATLKIDEPDRATDLEEIEQCLEELQGSLGSLETYIEGTGSPSYKEFKDAKKDVRMLKNQCKKTRKGRLPDPVQHQKKLDNFVIEYTKLKEIIGSLCEGFTKLCDLQNATHYKNGLDGKSDIKRKIRYLKRKLRKLKTAVGAEDPQVRAQGEKGAKWDSWIEQCEDCIAKANALTVGRGKRSAQFRVKRDDEVPGPNNIKQTKFPLVFGDDLVGSMDQILICLFRYPDSDTDDLQEMGRVIYSPPNE
ncbi:unnamed protein product [Owenia fusiformis]|uniref:Chitin-binding type-2 domain-containing protein n=1 Tax=Owenia fusiformis TaxID=6347 RepID=A0A8S4PIU2_OWEFU|nr:unnamed protein product [Owenia fusiformis]